VCCGDDSEGVEKPEACCFEGKHGEGSLVGWWFVAGWLLSVLRWEIVSMTETGEQAVSMSFIDGITSTYT
jgi:hypothetical protein